MRTIDRFLADGAQPPWQRSTPALQRIWEDQSAGLHTTGPTLVADNVAAYTRTKAFVLEEFPCLAPPWPSFWIEYPSRSGRERRAVIVNDATHIALDDHYERRREWDEAYRGAIADAREGGYDGPIRWVLQLSVLIESARHEVMGPIGWLILVLDEHGRCHGNRWVLNRPGESDYVYSIVGADHDPIRLDEWLITAAVPALQTIAFLHCRNVVLDHVTPSPKLAAAHRRRHGRPPVRYQTIRLEVPRRVAAGGRRSNGGGQAAALHIVPGNFHHYGDCCPGVHEPHGLLFGKHSGIYWIPQHVRGNPERGVNVSDYELVAEPPPVAAEPRLS